MSEPSQANPPGPSPILSATNSLKEAIWLRRPILGEIMRKHGKKTLFDYSRDFMDVNPAPGLDHRKDELIQVAQDLLKERLGKEVAEKVAHQLKKIPLVSTADHHSTIDHPFWVNANIISSLPYYNLKDPDLNYLVVLSFATVSMNNASGFPRGILFHGGLNGSGNLVRLPIMPDKLKMGVVYGTRPFTEEDLDRAESELSKKESEGEVVKDRGHQIRQMLGTYFRNQEVLKEPDFSSQITRINHALWPKFFHGKGKLKVPDLIYLDIETLVRETLLKHHLSHPNSLIYRVLFDSKYRPLILEYFNNLPGAFSTEKDWGTYFFWAVDEKMHRVRLKLEGNKLVSAKGTFTFDLTPESIARALREKQIFPSMLMCYLMISLYYGIKCLGGFCQVHDLTMIKEAWRTILTEMGHEDEAQAILPVQTKELGGDGMVLVYFKTPQEKLVPATGLDMLLDPCDTSIDNYVDLSREVSMEQMMNPMLPEMYTVLYPIDQRDPQLLNIKPEEIMEALIGTEINKRLSKTAI